MQAMQFWFLAALLGTATASMLWKAERFPLLAWIAHAPLGLALLWCTPTQAALAGALAGGFGSAPSVLIREFRVLLPITTIPSALALCLGSALGAHAIAALGTVWLALVLPGTVLMGLMPLRVLGAPRWVSNPLACTQERCLAMVHTARAFGDLGTTSLLALFASGTALVLTSRNLSVLILALGVLTLALVFFAFGVVSLRAAVKRMDASPRLRVAAVVADRPPRDNPDGLLPIESADDDADAAVRRYVPLVTRAVSEGAELIVLPEVSVHLDANSRERWVSAVTTWAQTHGITLVAPFFDASAPVNTLAVIDGRGIRATYDKQHPARRMEPPRRKRCEPGPTLMRSRCGEVPLSTVICVDLDYGDMVGPLRAAGGLLAVPSNDMFGGFDRRHHRTAVWAAVTTGVSILRAAGHGISAAYDGAGRLLGASSSESGPVALTLNVPLSPPRPRHLRRNPG